MPTARPVALVGLLLVGAARRARPDEHVVRDAWRAGALVSLRWLETP